MEFKFRVPVCICACVRAIVLFRSVLRSNVWLWFYFWKVWQRTDRGLKLYVPRKEAPLLRRGILGILSVECCAGRMTSVVDITEQSIVIFSFGFGRSKIWVEGEEYRTVVIYFRHTHLPGGIRLTLGEPTSGRYWTGVSRLGETVTCPWSDARQMLSVIGLSVRLSKITYFNQVAQHSFLSEVTKLHFKVILFVIPKVAVTKTSFWTISQNMPSFKKTVVELPVIFTSEQKPVFWLIWRTSYSFTYWNTLYIRLSVLIH